MSEMSQSNFDATFLSLLKSVEISQLPDCVCKIQAAVDAILSEHRLLTLSATPAFVGLSKNASRKFKRSQKAKAAQSGEKTTTRRLIHAEWMIWYREYLQSDAWSVIRTKVLERDGYGCHGCGKKATEVHHRSYSEAVMRGDDLLQLVSLCTACHNHIHWWNGLKVSLRTAGHRLAALQAENLARLNSPVVAVPQPPRKKKKRNGKSNPVANCSRRSGSSMPLSACACRIYKWVCS